MVPLITRSVPLNDKHDQITGFAPLPPTPLVVMVPFVCQHELHDPCSQIPWGRDTSRQVTPDTSLLEWSMSAT